MPTIKVEKRGKEFVVLVDGSEFSVTLKEDYYKKLAKGRTKEKLIEDSFRFLLEREPKESILRSFDLSVIQKYFPEFEEVI